MLPYILLFLFVGTFMVISKLARGEGLFIWFAVLLFFIGLRENIGADWDTYLLMYEEIGWAGRLYSAITVSDPLYALINWVAYKVNLDIYFVNFICAFIFSYGLVKFCRWQYNPMLGILVAMPYLVFVVAMGYTRQSAAFGVVCLALNALIDKKDFRFIILVFVAAGFHLSAIIMLCFLVIRLKAKYLLRFTMLFGVLCALAFYFVGHKLIGRLDLYTGGHLDSKGSLMRLGLSLIPAVFFIVKRNAFKKIMPSIYPVAVWLSIGSLGMFLLAFIFTTIADRFGLYFSLIQILIFANLPALMRIGGRLLYYCGVFVFYFIFLLVWLSTSYYAQNYWIPYDNILFHW